MRAPSRRRVLRLLPVVGLLSGGGGALACRQDMHDQPKQKPLAESDFFRMTGGKPDRRSARPPVPGTIARGHLTDDSAFYTGKVGDTATDTLPLSLSPELLHRGRTRFQTFCAPCHGLTGRGDGLIVQRGFRAPVSYHTDRLRQAPVGYFFDVITHGFGAMSDYAAQIPVEDRWAIAAYIRALQLSQNATLADVPEDKRHLLDRVGAPTGADETAAEGAHHP